MADDILAQDLPKAPAGVGGRSFREALSIQEPFLTRKAGLQKEITAAEGEEAKAKQAQAETLAQGKMETQQAYGAAQKGAMQQYEQKLEEQPLPEFIPTKDNAESIASLFSLIGVIGMIAGKQNAQQALGAMNGMLEGHMKGRQDLYKQEKATFEKNFQSMLKKHEEFRKEMEDAVKLASTDREGGMAAAELAATKAGSSIVQAQLRKGDLMGAYKLVDESGKGVEKAYEIDRRERQHAADMAQRERLAKDAKEHAERMAQIKAAAGGKGAAGTAAAQVERMTNAMTQVSGAIQSVANLPVTTTSPTFGQKDFKGLFTAPLSALNQDMSKETSQMMQGRMVGVARNLASLETGGAATGLAGLTDSIQAGIAIPSGAKLHVAFDRLAEMRRIVEDSARAALSSDKYTEDQKNLIRENVAIVQKAIPFTLDDVTQATIAGKGKSPKVPKEDRELSFTDYVSKYGVQREKEGEPETGKDDIGSFHWEYNEDRTKRRKVYD